MTTQVVSVLGNWQSAEIIFKNMMDSYAIGSEGKKKENPDTIRSQIQVYNIELSKLFRKLEEAQATNIQAYVDQAMINFAMAREEALKNKSIVDIFLQGQLLWIQYRDVECYIEELDSTYDLGNFLVQFDLVNCTFVIYSTKYFIVPHKNHVHAKAHDWQSYTNNLIKTGSYPGGRYENIPHPHVRGLSVCIGNLGGVLGPVIAKYQFNVAIELITGYLQNCNMHDSWGKLGPAWPLKSGPGIQAWSKEAYPKLTQEKWRGYIGYDGYKPQDMDKDTWWTTNNYTAISVDEDAAIKCILKLPDKRRTIKDIVNEQLIQEQPVVEEAIATDLLPISEEEAAIMAKQGQPVEYIAGIDEEGYETQIPAIRVDSSAAQESPKVVKKTTRKPRAKKVA